jgi:hypothetical protein
MKSAPLIFAQVAVLVAACAALPLETERAVYAAALPVARDPDHPLPALIIRERTITLREMSVGTSDLREELRRRLKTAPTSLIDQFLEKVASPRSLTPSVLTRISYPTQIASDSELSRVFSGESLAEGWKNFRRNYPNASSLVRFSPVAFEGNVALVYVEATCGPLCGSGAVVLLERRNGEWHVVQDAQLWIS